MSSTAARRWVCLFTCVLLSTPLRADVGLWFVRSPEPLVAPPGDEVVFDCSLNVPADQVRWRHGTRFLNNSFAMNHSTRSNRLVVRVNNASEAGNYQCVAWYGASALTSVSASLTLAELQPFPRDEDRRYEVSEGNLVVLRCEAPYSQPPAILHYLKNGHKLPVQLSGSWGALVLQNVTSVDSGNYSCTATNYLMRQTERLPYVMSLHVVPSRRHDGPRFLVPPPTNYTIQAGWNVTLECSGVGDPPPHSSWTRYGATLPQERARLVPGGLALRDVRKADEGTYLCELSNSAGSITHRTILHVQEIPVVVREPANAKVEEGGDVTLECEARASPAPHISWVLNGESLDNDSHAHISGGRLQLDRIQKRHAGIVQCFFSNVLGSSYGSATLQVVPKQVTSQPGADPFTADTKPEVSMPSTPALSGGKNPSRHDSHRGKGRKKHKGSAVMIPPSRPNITRLTDTSVMVHWSVPPNKGLPIQFFKLQHREMTRHRGRTLNKGWKTNNEEIAPHICSYEVDGLEPDRTYRFRVAAVYSNNDHKFGLNSAKFHLHRGSHLKNAPKLVRTEAVSPTVIQIFWEFPASYGHVDGFYVYYRATSSAGHYVKATVVGKATRSFNITHLLPDTAYDIKIQSFTIGGASDFSAILTHKTLGSPTERPQVVVVGASGNPEPQSSSSSQLFVAVGAACGCLLVLTAVFLLVMFLRHHRAARTQQPAADHGSQHDKLGESATAITSANAYATNLLNGSVPLNGYQQSNKMNITTNPLADADQNKIQNVMEMSFLSSRNNNCSSSEASSDGGSGAEDGSPAPVGKEREAEKQQVVEEGRLSAGEENYV